MPDFTTAAYNGHQFQASIDCLKQAKAHQESQLHTGIEELKRLILSTSDAKKRKGDADADL